MTVPPPACDSYMPPTAPRSSTESLIIPSAWKHAKEGSTAELKEPDQLHALKVPLSHSL
jgi:hypothetical protein